MGHDVVDVGFAAAIDDAAGQRHQRLDPARRLFGQRGAGLVLSGFAHRGADRGEDGCHCAGDIVEFGESLHAALHREVDEETGLKIEIVGLAGWREVLPPASGGGHYLIMSFAARWIDGEPVLNEELDDFRWVGPDTIGRFKLTSGLPEVVQSAWRLLRA